MSATKIFLTTTLFALVSSAQANVEDSNNNGWYVGGAIGLSTVDMRANGIEHDDDSESFIAYGGYNFTEWFGLEGGFLITGDIANNQDSIDSAYYSAASLTPKFTFQLTPRAALFAKVGLAAFTYTERDKDGTKKNSYDNLYKRTRNWDDVVATFGLGADYAATSNIHIRLAYDYFSGDLEKSDYDHHSQDGDNYEEIDAKLNQISLGVNYQF